MIDLNAFLVFASVDGAERRATIWATGRRNALARAAEMFPSASNIIVL